MKGKIIKLEKAGMLNPDKEALTVEKLKTFTGFEDLEDDRAQQIVFAIQTLASILYKFTNEQQKIKTIDELKNQTHPKQIAA